MKTRLIHGIVRRDIAMKMWIPPNKKTVRKAPAATGATDTITDTGGSGSALERARLHPRTPMARHR